MASFEFLAIILTGLSLSASILYYSYTIQSQNKTRRLQIVKDMWEWISDEEGYQKFVQLMTMTWSDYEDFNSKYGTFSNTESYALQFAVWNKMNGLGYMVKEGVIDIETIYDHSAGRVVWMWLKFEPVIVEIRRANDESLLKINSLESNIWKVAASNTFRQLALNGPSIYYSTTTLDSTLTTLD